MTKLQPNHETINPEVSDLAYYSTIVNELSVKFTQQSDNMDIYIRNTAKRALAALVDANQLATTSIDRLKIFKAVDEVKALIKAANNQTDISSTDKACDTLSKATDKLVRIELAIRKANLNTQLTLLGYTDIKATEINTNLENAATLLENADFFLFDGPHVDELLVDLENAISEVKKDFALMLNITSSATLLSKTSSAELQKASSNLANKTNTFQELKNSAISRYDDWMGLNVKLGHMRDVLLDVKKLDVSLGNSTMYAALIADAEIQLKNLLKEHGVGSYHTQLLDVTNFQGFFKRIEDMIPEMEALDAKASAHNTIPVSQNSLATDTSEYSDLSGYLRVGVPAVAITLACAVILVKMRADSFKRMGSYMANAIKSGLTFMSSGNNSATRSQAVSYDRVSTIENNRFDRVSHRL